MNAPDLFDLTGRRALVTGGSRGLGRAMAIGLAQAGARVVTLARTPLDDSDGLLGIVGDVTDFEDFPHLVDQAEDRLEGGVDLLLHGAGIQHRSPAVDFAARDFQHVVDVNLTAPFFLSQEVGRRQLSRKSGGAHLFVASLTSRLGLANIAAYAAAKSGVLGIMRTLAVEWAGSGIRANAVAPGYFRTALTEALFQNETDVARLSARIPMGRFGSPEDLAGAAVFLLSDASAYVTGQLLFVDGGWTAA